MSLRSVACTAAKEGQLMTYEIAVFDSSDFFVPHYDRSDRASKGSIFSIEL
jgi:hypothetical protein